MRKFIQWVYILVIIGLAYACCEDCNLKFADENKKWLPYSDMQNVVFVNSNSTDSIHFVAQKTTFKHDDKECNQVFSKINCFIQAHQILIPISKNFNKKFEIKVDQTKNLSGVSLYFTDSLNNIEADNFFYPGNDGGPQQLDSFRVNHKLYLDVYRISREYDSAYLKSQDIKTYYFNKQSGLLQIQQANNQVWSLK